MRLTMQMTMRQRRVSSSCPWRRVSRDRNSRIVDIYHVLRKRLPTFFSVAGRAWLPPGSVVARRARAALPAVDGQIEF